MDTNEKTRRITVTVPEEDARRFITRCAEYGIAPAEALAGFVADLICGRNTGGSDARMYAAQYFERLYDVYGYEENFLMWAAQTGAILDFAAELRDHDFYVAELEDAESPEDADELREIIASFAGSMRNIYGEYVDDKQRHSETPEAFEAAVASVRRYLNELDGFSETGPQPSVSGCGPERKNGGADMQSSAQAGDGMKRACSDEGTSL